MLAETPDASPKKPAAPFTMMAMEAKKASTTSVRAAIPAHRWLSGVRASTDRFTPSIMINRNMAMARGVSMSRNQYSAAPAATVAIRATAFRDTVEEGTATGLFIPALSNRAAAASIAVPAAFGTR